MTGRRRDDRDDRDDRGRRLSGDRGVAMVAGLVLLFAFTAGGVIWLARDVNRTVANRSVAQSIAFQAARSGAQQVAVGSLRDGVDREVVEVNAGLAEAAARDTAVELFADYGVRGVVLDVDTPEPDLVVVRVQIQDAPRDVTGVGSARAEAGP